MSVLESFRLDGKRACVTGGSRGLGFSMARGLAEAGADLVLVGRELASLESARAALAPTGRTVEILSADVGDPASSDEAASRVLADWGPIEILINNVGGRRIDVPTETLELGDWQRIIDLNLTSAFVWTKRLGGAMLPRGHGRVINVASISGLIANRGIAGRSYETSKAALLSFTRAVAADWAPSGVTVNAVAPGAVDTRMLAPLDADERGSLARDIPIGRIARPDEIASLVHYLAQPEAGYITGQVISPNGGWHT